MWDTPLAALKGVGPTRVAALSACGLETLLDLLHFIPVRYTALPPLGTLDDLSTRVPVSFVGEARTRRRGRLRHAKGGYLEGQLLLDGEASGAASLLTVRFYRQAYLFERFEVGSRWLISGRLDAQQRFIVEHHHQLAEGESPEIKLMALLPQWRPINGVPRGNLSRLLLEALGQLDPDDDPLPADLREQSELPGLRDALVQVHDPDSVEAAQAAGGRLLFDRFIARFLPALTARAESAQDLAPRIAVNAKVRDRIAARFPFELTESQNEVLEEIFEDLAEPVPMRRLLQGDVGAGKTAVALSAALAAIAAGRQALFVAPTEPLAHQHFKSIDQFLAGSRVHRALLTSRLPGKQQREVRAALSEGACDLVIGTHAILSERVSIPKLGLAIIDEQHRFGVKQRLKASKKGDQTQPHMLAMSATPIPRSLCLALMGDLDHSSIKKRPAGRQQIVTELDPGKRAFAAVRAAAERGEQAFIVFPSIEGEKMPALLREGLALVDAKGPLRGISWSMLHGRMEVEQRMESLADFTSGRSQLLLATVMVEVGIDVGNATVMVIYGAGRFGLSTLHQLRGRVGRSHLGGSCWLIPSPKAKPQSLERLSVLASEHDGFRLAEEDLRLRGPGELAGVRQSGEGGRLPVAPGRDRILFESAFAAAKELIARGLEDHPYWRGLRPGRLPAISQPADAV